MPPGMEWMQGMGGISLSAEQLLRTAENNAEDSIRATFGNGANVSHIKSLDQVSAEIIIWNVSR